MPCMYCVSVFCFVKVITLLSFYCHLFIRWQSCLFLYYLLFFTSLFLFRQSKQVQETVGRRRNGEPKYKKIARLLVCMLGNLWLKYFLIGNLGPEGPEGNNLYDVNASCHDGIDLDFRSVGEHTFRGTAIFKLNISCKAQLFWKNLRTNLVLFLAVYLLY